MLTGLQEHFADLPDRSPPPRTLGHIIDASDNLGHRVRDRGTEAHPLQKRQIDKIVADIGHLLIGQTLGAQDFPVRFELARSTLVKDIDAQFGGPMCNYWGRATGNDPHLDAGALQGFDALAVLDVESFPFVAAVVQHYPAIGQNTVDIEQQQANSGKTLPNNTTPAFSKSCK